MNYKNTFASLDEAREAAYRRSVERNYRSVYIYYVGARYDRYSQRLMNNSCYKIALTKYDNHKEMKFVEAVLAVSRKRSRING